MFRSALSINVLLGFVAGQLSAVPHAHAFASLAEQCQHDARPHVHLGHSHTHGHDHHHDVPDDKPAFPNRGSNHDADAIYLPPTYLPAIRSVAIAKAAQDHRAHSEHWISASLSFAIDDSPTVGSAAWHPPAASAASCALFLKLRNIRI